MQYIDAKQIEELSPYAVLMDSLDEAFRSDIEVPVRQHYAIDKEDPARTTLLAMPAWEAQDYIGFKLVTVCPLNQDRPSIQGSYILMDSLTGQTLAMMDAPELTARRTACASALASRYLSRETSKTHLIIGTGKLAPYFAEAHRAARPINQTLVYGRNKDKAEATVNVLSAKGMNAAVVDSLETAVKQADIITCVTSSKKAVIDGNWVQAGTHVDLAGAYLPDMRESDDALIKRARLFCDTFAGATKEAGDLRLPLDAGLITLDSIEADLPALARSNAPVRRSDDDITLFKSVGCAHEDYAAAKLIYRSLEDCPPATSRGKIYID
ncbi:ornithine cyclodeaminase [Kordiimonas sediminis]|uniref:Ornithine cyclodeaminase n=1 Tax=Kordiimonas sediminis TaxID=1735581 RepID=A0A919AR31_9PROT|nr:ornithine cyclodeaminase family protein [Kordiimonas sediminis]GHF21207.1 ornithine cyclodeaminase [Kordiimonas sediminis]